jgi:hypothetical protein
MTAHSLIHAEAERSMVHRVRRDPLLQLGWLHFWLLLAILGGMLAVVGLVLFAPILN